jgi:hypothetical protein
MGRVGFGAVSARWALGAAGVVLVACQSHQGSNGAAPGTGGTGNAGGQEAQAGAAGTSAGGTGGRGGSVPGSGAGGLTSGGGGPPSGGTGGGMAGRGGAAPSTGGGGGAIPVVDGGTGASGDGPPPPAVAACMPGTTVAAAASSPSEVWCDTDGTTFGVPNGAAVHGYTFLLPSALIAGADNAFSFEVTGSAPYDFELWGTSTLCKGEELLWWGPFGAGTQCAQFRPSKAYPNILFVERQMYSASYAFGTPRWTMCPGGTCPAGTTGTGKLSTADVSAPIGNYEFDTFDRLPGGADITLGRSGRMIVVSSGDLRIVGMAQPLTAGVFRLPATDPYGDAWYCIGEGSTLTWNEDGSGFFKNIQLSLRGVTRLGACEETPGSGSLSATIYPSTTSGTYFAADVTGTTSPISSWGGTNLAATEHCSGSTCNFRLRGASQGHFVHVTTTSTDLNTPAPAPVPVTSATWLVQPSSTQPFSMACSSEGTLDYQVNDTSKLQLAKVSSPRSCPGTPLSNDRLDLTIDRD